MAYDGIVHGLTDAEYHAQPELSSTGARTLLNDSPARFKWAQENRTETKAFDLGHVAHAKVLGVGLGVAVIPTETLAVNGAASTKDAKAFVAQARADGLVPIKQDEWEYVERMAEAVLAHPTARALIEPAAPELSVFATDPDTGVRVRARFDFLGDGYGGDLKTTAGTASARGFGIASAKYDYPVQDAWYTDALKWAAGIEVDFRFVVVEKTRPHFVAVHAFDETARLIASERAAEARRIYAECMATDTWPAYGDDLIHTELPNWWFAQNEAEEEIVV